jgi:hypothetical protein
MKNLSIVFFFGAVMILLVCISKPDYFFKNKSTSSLDINANKDSSSINTNNDSVESKIKLLSSSEKRIKILNKDIQQMVDTCIFLNGIENPNLIKNKQLIKWKFPDNDRFVFYMVVEPGQNLWVIAKELLIVTYEYRTK